MQNNLILFSKIPKVIDNSILFQYPKIATDYINLAFIKNWLVGFTNAEGSFIMKSNKDACYQLKQRTHAELFNSFKLIFDTTRKIKIEKGPVNYYHQFSVSSKLDIQKVINLFSFEGLHPLTGLKYIQYSKWLIILKNSDRYKNLKFPK